MIQPHAITNFSRTDYELQEFLLFCVCVAGKSSEQQAKKLEIFLAGHCGIGGMLPFEMIRMYGYTGVYCNLETTKMGQYKRITKAFLAIAEANLDLKTCTVEDLEKIPGVGCKTSRFFLVHSRPNQEYCILDTHLLRYMRDTLNIQTPKSTPTNPKVYYAFESKLAAIIKASGKTFAQYDLEVWSSRAK